MDIKTTLTHRSMEPRKEPQNKPIHTRTWSIDIWRKESQIYNEEKTVSSINGVGETRQPHTKKKKEKKETIPESYTINKN